MRKTIAQALRKKAEDVAQLFSMNRERNYNNETFEVEEITPLSEFTACVTFKKCSHKRSVAFFYWINSNGGYFQYFFPTDSHILGMELFGKYKEKIEKLNFNKNFEGVE